MTSLPRRGFVVVVLVGLLLLAGAAGVGAAAQDPGDDERTSADELEDVDADVTDGMNETGLDDAATVTDDESETDDGSTGTDADGPGERSLTGTVGGVVDDVVALGDDSLLAESTGSEDDVGGGEPTDLDVATRDGDLAGDQAVGDGNETGDRAGPDDANATDESGDVGTGEDEDDAGGKSDERAAIDDGDTTDEAPASDDARTRPVLDSSSLRTVIEDVLLADGSTQAPDLGPGPDSDGGDRADARSEFDGPIQSMDVVGTDEPVQSTDGETPPLRVGATVSLLGATALRGDGPAGTDGVDAGLVIADGELTARASVEQPVGGAASHVGADVGLEADDGELTARSTVEDPIVQDATDVDLAVRAAELASITDPDGATDLLELTVEDGLTGSTVEAALSTGQLTSTVDRGLLGTARQLVADPLETAGVSLRAEVADGAVLRIDSTDSGGDPWLFASRHAEGQPVETVSLGATDPGATGTDGPELTGSGDVPDPGSLPEDAEDAAPIGVALLVGSLAAVKTGVTGTGAATAGATSILALLIATLRSLLLKVGLLFGYSRYDFSDPLENENRRAIYETVRASPGVNVAALSEETGIPESTLRYHLRVLEHEDVLESSKVRGCRRFVPRAGGDDVELSAAIEEEVTREVLETLLTNEPATGSTLAEILERDPSTVSHHLSRLSEAGLVEREPDGPAVQNSVAPRVRAAFEETTASAGGRFHAQADD